MSDVTESGSLAGSVEGPPGPGPDVTTTKSEACELAPAAREVGCLHSTTTASQATGSDRLESGVVASMSWFNMKRGLVRVGRKYRNLFSLQRSEGQVESSSRGSKLIPMAEDLAIAGLVPLSSVDWPDHLVATVFYAKGVPGVAPAGIARTPPSSTLGRPVSCHGWMLRSCW